MKSVCRDLDVLSFLVHTGLQPSVWEAKCNESKLRVTFIFVALHVACHLNSRIDNDRECFACMWSRVEPRKGRVSAVVVSATPPVD